LGRFISFPQLSHIFMYYIINKNQEKDKQYFIKYKFYFTI
jgi:hypothetical protein